jgi:lipid-A-disaccharide synthase-like uncharacterized protein
LTGVLAFQVWDVFGWAGQAVFTWRVVHQWLASERARESIVPRTYWAWSLLGTALLLVYLVHRRDPVFVLGTLVNGSIYARNLWMSREGAPRRPLRRSVLWPVVLGLALFAAVSVEALGPDHGLVHFERPLAWLVVGFVGQVLWSGRFVVQWIASERRGESILPPAFFWMSIVGSMLLFSYAVSQRGPEGPDWVNTAAYALNPIPYARNLVLLSRRRRASAAGAPGGPPSPA